MPIPPRHGRSLIFWLIPALIASLALGCRAAEENQASPSNSQASATPLVPGEDPVPHASVRLMASSHQVRPGETVEVGISFTIDPGWHLYWKGRNDSGLYPTVSWQSSGPGTPGDLRWPVPERLVSPGSILDHVYRDRVTLLVPVIVSDEAAPGEEIVLNGDVSWIACREACFAEEGQVTLRLRVAGDDPARDAEAAALLDEARGRLPRPVELGEHIRVHRTGDRLSLHVSTATEITFYPGLDGVELADAVRDGHAEGDHLELQMDDPGAGAHLRGVLEVRYAAPRPARYFDLNLIIPAPAG